MMHWAVVEEPSMTSPRPTPFMNSLMKSCARRTVSVDRREVS
jgi:hypothetical protein